MRIRRIAMARRPADGQNSYLRFLDESGTTKTNQGMEGLVDLNEIAERRTGSVRAIFGAYSGSITRALLLPLF